MQRDVLLFFAPLSLIASSRVPLWMTLVHVAINKRRSSTQLSLIRTGVVAKATFRRRPWVEVSAPRNVCKCVLNDVILLDLWCARYYPPRISVTSERAPPRPGRSRQGRSKNGPPRHAVRLRRTVDMQMHAKPREAPLLKFPHLRRRFHAKYLKIKTRFN